MHCMLMDLLHGFEVLSTTEETLFNSRNILAMRRKNFEFYKIFAKCLGIKKDGLIPIQQNCGRQHRIFCQGSNWGEEPP